MAISLSNNKHTATRVRARLRRQARGRKKVSGTEERPRLVVTRSSKHITVQVVDDLQGRTLAYASTMEADLRAGSGDKTAKAKAVGELVADGPGLFAGYWGDPDADAERMRGGRFHSGDLAYVDDDGWVYFAGRSGGWMRVDGENLAAAPVDVEAAHGEHSQPAR